MIADDRLERLLADVLDAGAPSRPPDRLVPETLRAVRTTQRWPRWYALLREPPMRLSSRVAVGSPTVRLAVVAAVATALITATVAAVGAAASLIDGPSTTLRPFGPARNGALVFADAGDIWTAPPSGDPVPLVTGPEVDGAPRFSHDGTRLLFRRGLGVTGNRLMVASPDGSGVVEVLGPGRRPSQVEWSPDDTRLLIYHEVHGAPTVTVVDVATGASHPVDVGAVEPNGWALWRPPDGREIIFRGIPTPASDERVLYAVRPDGTGLRRIGEPGDPNAFQGPEIGPDGSMIAFWNWEPNAAGLSDAWGHRRDLDDGSDLAILDSPAGVHGSNAVMAPDGASFAFEDFAPTEGLLQLHVARWDGSGGDRAVGPTFRSEDRLGYRFSPDGSSLLLSLSAPSPRSILIDVVSGSWTEATGTGDEAPTWQRLPGAPADP